MDCDTARSSLFEPIDDAGDGAAAERAALLDHVAGCASCSADLEAIRAWRQRADAWQDESVPRWRAPRIERPPARDWRMWFPAVASTAALALAAFAVLGPRPGTDAGPSPAPGLPAPAVAQYDPALQARLIDAALTQLREELESRREIDRSFLLQAAMDAARDEREEELAAVASFLKAEMDRRYLETDENLRYLITDQVQDRRRLEDLFQRVGTRRDAPENRR